MMSWETNQDGLWLKKGVESQRLIEDLRRAKTKPETQLCGKT